MRRTQKRRGSNSNESYTDLFFFCAVCVALAQRPERRLEREFGTKRASNGEVRSRRLRVTLFGFETNPIDPKYSSRSESPLSFTSGIDEWFACLYVEERANVRGHYNVFARGCVSLSLARTSRGEWFPWKLFSLESESRR